MYKLTCCNSETYAMLSYFWPNKGLATVSKKIDFIIRMSKTCYKKPISESLGFVYSKLEKMALKAKKTKKSVLKQFQMKGNIYSVVIVYSDEWGSSSILVKAVFLA